MIEPAANPTAIAPGTAVDVQNLTVTPLAASAVTVERFQVSFTLNDPMTGQVLQDFTGANQVFFPDILHTLTALQRRQVFDFLFHYLLRVKLGL